MRRYRFPVELSQKSEMTVVGIVSSMARLVLLENN